MFSSLQMDQFLLNIGPDLSRVLTLLWGVKHLCNLCEEGFLLGVDGKHCVRRYTCACKDVGVEHIEALGGVAIRKPCCNRAFALNALQLGSGAILSYAFE